MLFASVFASWWVRDGVVVDTVSVGTGGSLLFGGLAFVSAVAYLAAIAVTIALRERS